MSETQLPVEGSTNGGTRETFTIVSLEANDPTTPLLNGSQVERKCRGISRGLCVLFFINGFTLAFCMTALLSMVNNRAKVPVALIPSYASVAFLPYPWKALYGWLSKCLSRISPEHQLAGLLLLSALTYNATDLLIPPDSVVMCFVIAFLRSFFAAWPEFLLFAQLLDEAHASGLDGASVLYQSQAATTRTIGSLSADILSLILYASCSSRVADAATLHLSALGNVVAAIVAWRCWRNAPQQQIPNEEEEPVEDPVGDSAAVDLAQEEDQVVRVEESTSETMFPLCMFVLQITVVLYALKEPIISETSQLGWDFIFMFSLLGLASLVYFQNNSGGYETRVGVFLILRHSVPSVSYLVDTYLFQVFNSMSKAYMMPLLSILSMMVSALASWSFGRFFRPFGSSHRGIMWILGGTKILSFVTLLATSRLISFLHSETVWQVVGAAIVLDLVLGYTDEFKFLPSLVLATNESNEDHLQYGALLSCIDVGDQIGALLLAPMVGIWAASGSSSSYDHLDDLQVMQAILTLASVCFLLLLRK